MLSERQLTTVSNRISCVAKDKKIETIADELETTIEEIRPICDAVKNASSDANPMEIYSRLQS